MECKQIRGAVSEYLDGEVAVDLRDQITHHLDQCHPCREYKEAILRLAVQPFKELEPLTPPDALWTTLQRKIQPLPKTGFRWGWLFPKPALGFASLIGVMILASFFVLQPRPASPTKVYLAEQLLFLSGMNGDAIEAADDDYMGTNLEGFLMS